MDEFVQGLIVGALIPSVACIILIKLTNDAYNLCDDYEKVIKALDKAFDKLSESKE
jgi:hypothetical protein